MTNPVSNTAFYCGGVRMQDALHDDPLVGDRYAERLMGEDGRRLFEPFAGQRNPNGINVTRHGIIDDMLRERFKGNPLRLAVVIGTGLDTRPFRMATGRWVEFDEAPIIERKERLLPSATCLVPLTRIPIDFAHESLADKLAPWATNDRVSVVMEGVMMYLDEAAISETCRTLFDLMPNHTLICDLMSEKFLRRYGGDMQKLIEQMGAKFKWVPKRPLDLFEYLGYRKSMQVSIAQRAATWDAISAPPWIVKNFLPTLRDGFGVYALKGD